MADSADSLVNCLRALLDPARHETAADNTLLARWVAERDERAFAALVWRHRALVWRVGRSVLTQIEDAEDVFQATFLVLARRASSLKGCSSLAGWLYQTAYHLALNADFREAK
jgi:DNA-directed RNA polymerase specialized sigma24 family protein